VTKSRISKVQDFLREGAEGEAKAAPSAWETSMLSGGQKNSILSAWNALGWLVDRVPLPRLSQEDRDTLKAAQAILDRLKKEI